MKDTTLLDSKEPLTMNQLRGYFLSHDFSAQTSGYNFKDASSEHDTLNLNQLCRKEASIDAYK